MPVVTPRLGRTPVDRLPIRHGVVERGYKPHSTLPQPYVVMPPSLLRGRQLYRPFERQASRMPAIHLPLVRHQFPALLPSPIENVPVLYAECFLQFQNFVLLLPSFGILPVGKGLRLHGKPIRCHGGNLRLSMGVEGVLPGHPPLHLRDLISTSPLQPHKAAGTDGHLREQQSYARNDTRAFAIKMPSLWPSGASECCRAGRRMEASECCCSDAVIRRTALDLLRKWVFGHFPLRCCRLQGGIPDILRSHMNYFCFVDNPEGRRTANSTSGTRSALTRSARIEWLYKTIQFDFASDQL
ncbi:hypothetical protein Ddep01_03252 [Deinococcus depolymerans]